MALLNNPHTRCQNGSWVNYERFFFNVFIKKIFRFYDLLYIMSEAHGKLTKLPSKSLRLIAELFSVVGRPSLIEFLDIARSVTVRLGFCLFGC